MRVSFLISKLLLIMVLGITFIGFYIGEPLSVFAQSQQGGTTQYTYDKNGRLKKVILPTGEAVTYEYDPAGNITSIIRTGPSLAIFSFNPTQGIVGTEVTFTGVGFGPNIGANTLSFNGTLAEIVSATTNQIVAKVPEGATTGIVTINTPQGPVSTFDPFTVIPSIRVSPSTITLQAGQSFQFLTVPSNQNVKWYVNGVEGGNIAIGLISPTGFYTASNSIANGTELTIKATSLADENVFGEAIVRIKQDLAAPISRLSVHYGTPRVIANPRSEMVSIKKGIVELIDGFLSVTTGPVISSITPNTIPRATTTSVTINGTNLNGTTSIRFIRDTGATDSTITVSNILVNGDGSSLTANFTVTGTSPLGVRVVLVTTPNGTSLSTNVGTNRIEIVAP